MFKKRTMRKYPPRQWALVGFAGDGKSTFASQMKSPLLPIDADHRFIEVERLVTGDVFELSPQPEDNNSPDAVERILAVNMPGAGVKTIVVDSLTAILVPIVARAMRDNAAGLNKNKISAFVAKSTARAQLQHAVSRWGCDTLWIYHLEKGRDSKGKLQTRTSITEIERNRLAISLNMELYVVRDEGQWGVKVTWARNGQTGVTLWDKSGYWKEMPERIEAAVYDAAWVPDKAEFFNSVRDQLSIPIKQAAALLKEKGYTNGYDWRKAAEMFEVLRGQPDEQSSVKDGEPPMTEQHAIQGSGE